MLASSWSDFPHASQCVTLSGTNHEGVFAVDIFVVEEFSKVCVGVVSWDIAKTETERYMIRYRKKLRCHLEEDSGFEHALFSLLNTPSTTALLRRSGSLLQFGKD